VWISGQVRRVTASIRREMKRLAAVEPVIGHLKAKHRMGRNYLRGPEGDRINADLAAAGYNFGLLLRWLAELLRAFITALAQSAPHPHTIWQSFRAGTSRPTDDTEDVRDWYEREVAC
jgi:IS5 family transposase